MMHAVLSLYLLTAMLATLFLAAYAVSRGRTAIVRVFSLLGLAVSIHLFGYLAEINVSSLPEMVFWHKVQYLVIPFYPAVWLLLALLYTRAIRTVQKRLLIPLMVIPVIAFLSRFTNEYHYRFFASATVQETALFPMLALEAGPLYYVQSAFFLVCFLIALVSYVIRSHGMPTARRRGYLYMLIAAFILLASVVPMLTGIAEIPLNYPALVLPAAMLLQMRALQRYDFLSLRTLAREIVFEHTTDGMIVVDEARGFIDANAAACLIVPELEEALTGTAVETLFSMRPTLLDILSGKNRRCGATEMATYDGRYYQVKVVSIKTSRNIAAGTLLQLVDITEEKQAREELARQATTDNLTALANRASFMERAKKEFQFARQRGQPFSLVMIDIDHFKHVNDTYGHAAGDEAIRYLADAMREHFRKTDLPARIGGEEFAVLMPDTRETDAVKASDEFRRVIDAGKLVYDGHHIHLTISIGVAGWSRRYSGFDALMKDADQCLYRSKEGGRNRVTALAR